LPHIILEYADDAATEGEIVRLLHDVHDALKKTDIFHEQNIKIRAVPVTQYLVGGKKEQFVHVQLRIKPGRTQRIKKKLSQEVLSVVSAGIQVIGVITVEVVDMDAESYAKKQF